jgi:hypothetical protein
VTLGDRGLDSGPPPGDSELESILAEVRWKDPTGQQTADVLRETFDLLYDGQHTGRWHFGQLFKTEKTHMGTLVEINLQRSFDFEDGDATDYRIAGIDVDCKYSMKDGGWSLPPEVVGHWALLVTADDAAATWRAGLLKVWPELLNPGRNRDGKATLSKAGRDRIVPIWNDPMRLPENVFLSLPRQDVDRIFRQASGQARVNELFRVAQGRIIRRAEVATVAQQDDFMKRVRANGGARERLRNEGILLLGHERSSSYVAHRLRLPLPRKGEFLSIRLAPAPPGGGAVEIDGEWWRLAGNGDPVTPAPVLPRDPPVGWHGPWDAGGLEHGGEQEGSSTP